MNFFRPCEDKPDVTTGFQWAAGVVQKIHGSLMRKVHFGFPHRLCLRFGIAGLDSVHVSHGRFVKGFLSCTIS